MAPLLRITFLIWCVICAFQSLSAQQKGVQNLASDSLFAFTKLSELKASDHIYELYSRYEKIKPPIERSNDVDIKMLPLKGFVFNWKNYKGERANLERFLVPDSAYVGIMQYYKDSLLGCTDFRKQNEKWNFQGFTPFDEANRSAPFFSTYFTCRKMSTDVFTIRTGGNKWPYHWGYIKDGKLNVVSFYYGQVTHYSDFDQWARKMIPPSRKQ